MRVTWDKSVDAAYIYLKQKLESGEAAKTYPCDPREVGGQINLDFDADGVLIGVEVLDARSKLPAELLEQAEIIG